MLFDKINCCCFFKRKHRRRIDAKQGEIIGNGGVTDLAKMGACVCKYGIRILAVSRDYALSSLIFLSHVLLP